MEILEVGRLEVTGLSCYKCGTLADSARNVQDCDPSKRFQVEQCGINEACVVFKRLYKKGSASLRGCYPVSDTLPGLRGAQIFPQRECDFQPKRRSPVKPSERQTSGSTSGGYFQDPLEEEEWSGDTEDFLSLWDSWDKNADEDGNGNEILKRTPRQASQVAPLGQQRMPVSVTKNCQLQRTQTDPSSSIRACICTSNLCNDNPNEGSKSTTALHELTQRFRRQNPGPFLTRLPASRFITEATTNSESRPGDRPQSLSRLNDRLRQFPFFQNSGSPMDCKWSDFTQWSGCSKSCNAGIQTRERHIVMLARNGGKHCEGEDKETRFCNIQQCPPTPEVICPTVNVLGATYARCDGEYRISSESVEWAPDRPVFKHVGKDRYIFWNAGGLGWSIGKRDYLTTGSHWHRSGLDSDEPWQGPWERGVVVECVKDKPSLSRAENSPASPTLNPDILNDRANRRPVQSLQGLIEQTTTYDLPLSI
ncbi:hypothetical protein TCAL_01259 [Tigriopus californicus]|uniref:Spondin-like TSP1 domain-containing protein n=1 Tax=Tigriopus californicus TaxID=6832 RepID=A0A553PDF4_TIGCA|nr:hypothetical protein TCAL_01259 [Tigriopus californicus]